MGFCFWTPTGQSRRMGLSQRRHWENASIRCPFKGCVVRRGRGAGVHKARRCWRRKGCWNLHASPLQTARAAQPAGTQGEQRLLSPCLGWSRNSRRPVAFSPPLLRATDPSLTDRVGNVQMVWVSVASGARCPHRPSLRPADLFPFSRKPPRKDCLSSAALGWS